MKTHKVLNKNDTHRICRKIREKRYNEWHFTVRTVFLLSTSTMSHIKLYLIKSLSKKSANPLSVVPLRDNGMRTTKM